MQAAYRAHDAAFMFRLCSLSMKIISLIKGSLLVRTNKEQNTLRCKLYFARRAWRGRDDLGLHDEWALLVRTFAKRNTTMTGNKPGAARGGRPSETDENLNEMVTKSEM
jgi:hypothetical protein